MRTKEQGTARPSVAGMLRDRRGSVATIFAVAMVPVTIAAGIGIDMARASTNRQNLQDAVDATALAVAHLPSTTPQATLEAKATAWLNANLNNPSLGAVTLTVTPGTGQVVLKAATTVPTTLTAIAGYRTMPISATSTVKWGLGHVEVALVLDNTGSMAGTKLSRLKTAATDLVDTLADSTDSTDASALKIGVVPFAATVKIGSSYRTSTWMSGVMPSAYGEDIFTQGNVNRFTMLDNIDESWGGCVESRPPPYDVQDTAPSSGTPKTLFVPYFAPDEPDDDTIESNRYRDRHNNWVYEYYTFPNNYLDDANSSTNWKTRQGNKNKYDEDINSRGGSPNAGCGMQSLVRLTTNMTTVKSKITAMNASGNTNIPIGLMWGWHVLSPNLPFADGAAYSDSNTKKFVVLLTDGDNTNDENGNPNNSNYSALGYLWQKRLFNSSGTALDETSTAQQRSDAMDARMILACSNMKAAGITIYTVRIDVSGSASTALQSCASSSDKYYDIDSSGLSSAFANIAGSIGRLRISN